MAISHAINMGGGSGAIAGSSVINANCTDAQLAALKSAVGDGDNLQGVINAIEGLIEDANDALSPETDYTDLSAAVAALIAALSE